VIPEPANTILVLNMFLGLGVSTLTGCWIICWMFEKFMDWAFNRLKVWDVLLTYAMYHREFKQWLKDRE